MSAQETADAIILVIRRILRKLARLLLWLTAAVLVLAGTLWGYNLWEDRPVAVVELNGIRLGERLSDAEFSVGQFKLAGDQPKDPNERHYYSTTKPMHVLVVGGQIKRIGHLCLDNALDFTVLSKIMCGASGEEIRERFKSVQILCEANASPDDARRRAYDVPALGFRYVLTQNKVTYMALKNDEAVLYLEDNKWVPCK